MDWAAVKVVAVAVERATVVAEALVAEAATGGSAVEALAAGLAADLVVASVEGSAEVDSEMVEGAAAV